MLNKELVLWLTRDIFEAFSDDLRLVGGTVRDVLKDKFPKDFDFATPKTPEEILKLFENSERYEVYPTGLQHGTVTIHDKLSDMRFEVTTLRKDILPDGRHSGVLWTDSYEEDAARRDFTMNSMYMDSKGEIYDPFGGAEHIKERKVIFIGSADARIKEDYLRIIRYIRFMSEIQRKDDEFFWYDGYTKEIKENLQAMVETVSRERFWQEFKKVSDKNIIFFLFALDFYGISEALGIPEDNGMKANKPLWWNLAKRFTSDNQLKAFCQDFKMSNYECRKLLWYRNLPDDLSLNDFLSRIYSSEFSEELPFIEEHQAIRNLLKFPIKASDFPLLSGKPLGDKLRQLEELWKQSNFTYTREELLLIS